MGRNDFLPRDRILFRLDSGPQFRDPKFRFKFRIVDLRTDGRFIENSFS